MIERVRLIVTGRVHGVGYRASCAREAGRIGVAGTVRNRPDSAVEVLAMGTPEQIGALVAWCHVGPPFGKVSGVEVSVVDESETVGFGSVFRVVR